MFLKEDIASLGLCLHGAVRQLRNVKNWMCVEDERLEMNIGHRETERMKQKVHTIKIAGQGGASL